MYDLKSPWFQNIMEKYQMLQTPQNNNLQKEKAHHIWQMHLNFKHAEPLAENKATKQNRKQIPLASVYKL